MKQKKIMAAITIKDLIVALVTEVQDGDVVVITTKSINGNNSYVIEIMEKYMPWSEAREYMHSLKLKARTEEEGQKVFHEWWDANKELAESIGLPRNPDEVYAK